MIFRSRYNRAASSERGNIFFTLFGAVALIGILGAGIMAVIRGPLTTVVEVNRRAQTDSEMNIASKLALLEATEAANDGDCDGDGFVEALEPKDPDSGDAPVGGGYIPDAVGAKKQDPWGTLYGYCAWDAGPVTGNGACDDGDADTLTRLSGTGDSSETYTVIAVISAGPNGIFETTCTGGATPEVTKAADSDDVISQFDYQSATAASGGLWNIKSGTPDTAEINKNIEVTGEAKFSQGIDLSDPAFSPSAQLKLGAASMLFPDQNTLANCNLANAGLIRLNTSVDPDSLQLCDDASNAGTGPFTWQGVSSGIAAGPWTQISASRIHFGAAADTFQVGINNDNPGEALDVKGNFQLTGDIQMADSTNLSFSSGNSVIFGDATTLRLNADGGTSEITVEDRSVEILAPRSVGTTSDSSSYSLQSFDSSNNSLLFVRNDGNVGIGDNTPSYKLDVNGDINLTGSVRMDGEYVLSADVNNNSIALGNLDPTGGLGSEKNTIIGFQAGANVLAGPSYQNTLIGFGADIADPALFAVLNVSNIIQGDISSGEVRIGEVNPYDISTITHTLEVAGSLQVTGDATIEGNINASDADVTVDDNLIVNGTITGTTFAATSTITLNGSTLNPSECTSSQKLEWDNATGWTCVTDLQGGTGGAAPTLQSLGVPYTRIGSLVLPLSTVVTVASDDYLWGDTAKDHTAGLFTADSRMFYDRSSSAFRMGTTLNEGAFPLDGTAWDDSNLGVYSTALGYNLLASGSSAFASGHYGIASGAHSIAMGRYAFAFGQASFAAGQTVIASGHRSIALGQHVYAGDGTRNAAAPYAATNPTVGESSMAVGLLTGSQTTKPRVTGQRSLGVFMGSGNQSQSGLVLSATDVAAFFGGKMLVDPRLTSGAARTIAAADVRGTLDLGYGTDALITPIGTTAERPGTTVDGMVRYNSTLAQFEGRQAGAWMTFDLSAIPSDARLKKDLKPLGPDMLDRLAQIDTYAYTLKADETHQLQYGVIAQQLEKTFPELVAQPDSEKGYKQVYYTRLIAPMIEGIKTLRAQNRGLQEHLASLQKERDHDDARLQALERQVEILSALAPPAAVSKASFAPSLAALLMGLGFACGAGAMAFFRRKLPRA